MHLGVTGASGNPTFVHPFEGKFNGNQRQTDLVTPVEIVVYRFTGRQGWFTVPGSWCRECDLTVRSVERVAAAVDVPVRIDVRPWWVHLPRALLRGAWHPPAVLVDRRLVVQGRVPSDEALERAIRGAAGRRAALLAAAPIADA